MRKKIVGTGKFPAALRRFGVAGAVAALLLMPQAYAGELDKPTATAMVGDALIARPIGAVMTAVGAVAFVVTLPFSAAGGNIGDAAQTLVVGPAKTTFVRCLGCKNPGRKPKRAE